MRTEAITSTEQLDVVVTEEIANLPNIHVVDYEYAQGEVEVHGARSKYTAAVPLGELASDQLIIYVNGLGAFKKTMRGVRNATASEGAAALSSAPVRKSDRSPREDLLDATTLHVDHLTAILDDLPNNTELRDGTKNGSSINFDKVNIAGHSYGGDIAVTYAMKHPEDIANLVLIKPAGQENPGINRVWGRLLPFGVHELLPFLRHHNPDFSLRDAGRAARHIGQSPLQTIGEIYACIRSDHRDDLVSLVDNMGLAILTGEYDNLIPAGPIEERSADTVHYYKKLPTNHLGPQNQPRLIAHEVIIAFAELEAKRLAGTLLPRLVARVA